MDEPMINAPSPKDFPWKRSRSGFAVVVFFSLLVTSTILRLVLLSKFGFQDHPGIVASVAALLIGFHQDFFVALFATLPLLFWLWILPDRIFTHPAHRALLVIGSFLFWFGAMFLCFTEFYFFDEFRSRFNTVAVDYLLYPNEVFGNIRDSYPLPRVIAICCGIALVWVVLVFHYFRQMWYQPSFRRSRLLHFIAAVVICFGVWLSLAPSAGILPAPHLEAIFDWVTARTQGTHFSPDRTINEVANNGPISFVNAALTRNLDYSAFYRTIDKAEAYQRVRKLLTSPGKQFVGGSDSIRRHVAGDGTKPKLNVVILMEESLGSEFWGCLGNTNGLTPEMDRLSTSEGLLFTNLYASGNRTVRGFEGVLSSFPPLPGDSIVKRDHSDNVETIARVLKRDGYSTVFFYGGHGLFDSMRSYTMRNGYDRFIEQKDFPNPTFTTVWGVCDEDVFARAIQEFRELDKAGKPFLGTVMTVSNHKPYLYPRGRIPDDPEKPKRHRNKAVKYSDWCLGQFFQAAKKEAFWTNTVFVVVADHGARVYGSQSLPIFSYEIPLVILGPAVVKQPQRVGVLGGSLDVSPTVLGLIGRPYDTMFFGRDLLHDPADEGRAYLNHNRDIGMYADARMVVLGLQKTLEYYEGDPKKTELKPVTTSNPTPAFTELEKNATAIYQVADDLYMHDLYRIDGVGETVGTNSPPKTQK
jgi:phosphoglycerol transferase MdoB-like AlkP superfamily enzyme